MTSAPVTYRHNQEEVVADVLGGEAVIINIAQGFYYGTKGLGGWVWERIGQGSTVDQLVADVTAACAVDAGEARGDIEAFIASLTAERLIIEAPHDGSVDDNRPAAPTDAPYEKPVLDIYRDMKDLLALDPPMPMLSGVSEDQ